jgi:hypothetical protein
MKTSFLLLSISILTFASCKQGIIPPGEQFKQTWYAGKAEISSYSLEQARYGEIRNGEATLIFVTEDFSADKLVKLDEPAGATDKMRVLKMNMNKKFVTGIYPYSMMLSLLAFFWLCQNHLDSFPASPLFDAENQR